MLYIEYIVLALLTVFLSVKLATYVDALDKKTNLSGAFIGGVMLAAVTSLPELFTSLTAVFSLDKPSLIQGNVLGSNIFNLSILGVLMIFAHRKFMHAKIAKSNQLALVFAILMNICVIAALLFHSDIDIFGFHIDFFSIALLVVYGLSVMFMRNDDSGNDDDGEDTLSLSVKQVVLRFIIYAILLVITSIFLTQVSDQLTTQLHLGATVGGAIFLGVATSLPELSASISLVRMNNFNASVGNIVGSCVFNFIILCFADILYTKSGIYSFNEEALMFAICGISASIITVIGLRYKKLSIVGYAAGIGILLCYLASIVVSV